MAFVALVRPPQVVPLAMYTPSQGTPPIGLAYLAGSLKAAGHRVMMVDGLGEAVHAVTKLADTGLLINGLTASQIVERIPSDVDVIGVSCTFSNEWIYSQVVIRAILDRFPTVPVIVGGEHITAEPEYTLARVPDLHSCVLGEGEDTIVDLIDAIEKKRPLESVPGLAFLGPHGIVRTPARARIRAVDDIPLPSWEEAPLETYLVNGLGFGSVRGRTMPMIASRGCPYQCTFCSNPVMWTQRWVVRTPRLVVDEMKLWMRTYHVTRFEFYDLTAIVRKEWILEFANLLIKEQLNVAWALPSGTRSEALDGEVLDRLYLAGCTELTYAPESGSPATLTRIKKQVKLPRMLASMRMAAKRGLIVKANLIVGFPGETRRDVAKTFAFMTQMAVVGVTDIAYFAFAPYPGSELFRFLVERSKIDRNGPGYDAFLSGNVVNEVSGMRSWSEHISDFEIRLYTMGGMAWFYSLQFLLRPFRMIQSAYRLFGRGRPRTALERGVDGLIRNFLKGKRLRVRALEQMPVESESASRRHPAPMIAAASTTRKLQVRLK